MPGSMTTGLPYYNKEDHVSCRASPVVQLTVCLQGREKKSGKGKEDMDFFVYLQKISNKQ